MDNQSLEIIGYIGNVFLLIGYTPQIIKTIRTKKAEDISIFMWIFYLMGDLFALTYAILTRDPVFMILFGFFTCGNIILIYLTHKYGKASSTPHPKLKKT